MLDHFGVNYVFFVIRESVLFSCMFQWQITHSLYFRLSFREMGYDGIVLESWSRWAGYGILRDPELRNLVTKLLPVLKMLYNYLPHMK